MGSNVYSTGNGVVVRAGWAFGYGRLIAVDHGFGYQTRYGHLQKIEVAVGDTVSRGSVIGKLGNSGRSTGPHLHYEVRLNGRAVNPLYYYNNDLSEEEYERMIDYWVKNTE
jgi:murein DD-endopeptidase MepM/ murein hydrolase activator NlpD